ncbi:MAG: hypothetical protein AAGJ93_07875 [Bacteroidota bacterium]
MQVSIDISLYPLQADYEPAIIQFIQRLNQHEGLQVATNELSTHVTGEYDLLLPILQQEMKTTFSSDAKYAFVLKILNVDIDGEGETLSF